MAVDWHNQTYALSSLTRALPGRKYSFLFALLAHNYQVVNPPSTIYFISTESWLSLGTAETYNFTSIEIAARVAGHPHDCSP